MAARRKRDTYHHGNLRSALVEEALALITEVGPEGLTLKQLAHRLGVSHPALYRHFASKAALFEAIAVAGYGMLRESIARALAAAPANPRGRFLSGGWAYVAFAVDHPAHFRVMFFGRKRDPSSADLIGAATSAFDLLLDFICHAQGERVIGPGDPYAVAMPIWAMNHGLASLACSGRLDVTGRPTMKRLVDEAHVALLDGLARGVSSPRRLRRAPKRRGT